MGIPIVSELWDGIRWLVDFFMNKAPRPIQIIFFLVFLLSLGNLLVFLFHVGGIHCDSSKNVVTVSPLNIGTNIRVAFLDKDDVLNTTISPGLIYTPGFFTPFIQVPVEACSRSVCYVGGKYYYSVEDECDNETILTGFALDSSDAHWIRCVDCSANADGGFNKTFIYGSLLSSESKYLCFDDVTRIDDLNIIQKVNCNPDDRCVPPENYYYEYDTNRYECLEPSVCGDNTTAPPKNQLDQYLLAADAELMYTDTNMRSMDNALLFKCSGNYNPRLTFFGVDVFDYRIWIVMIILFVMFIFLSKIKRH